MNSGKSSNTWVVNSCRAHRDDVGCTDIDRFAEICFSLSARQITSAWRRPCSTAFPGRRRCVLLERQSNGLHAATVIGFQHESLWLVHRRTTVKCSKGHVRHATAASDQLPPGSMLDALRAPPVPPALDAPPLKRSRDTPSSTQPSDFADANEFAQRAQTASVPMPRTPEPVVPAPETPLQPVSHGNVDTTVVSQ